MVANRFDTHRVLHAFRFAHGNPAGDNPATTQSSLSRSRRAIPARLAGLLLPSCCRRCLSLALVWGGLCGVFCQGIASAQSPQQQANGQDSQLHPPLQVAGFSRVDVLRRDGGNDVTAGYALADTQTVAIVTIRVRPSSRGALSPLLGGNRAAEPADSASPLAASIAEVRHYYPGATIQDVHNVFLVKRGTLQGGRAATLRYVDFLAGKKQPVQLDIYMFCCVDDRWAYEYRVRHAADQDVSREAHAFMQALPWSTSPQDDAGAGR